MAGTHVESDVRELLSLAELLKDSALDAQDRVRLLKSLGVETERQSQDRFDTKIDPEGKRWKDIAESTHRFLARHFPQAQPPLIRTGAYRDSIESQLEGSWSIKTGSSKEYALYLQDGTKRMPARKVFGLSSSDIKDLQQITIAFLENQI